MSLAGNVTISGCSPAGSGSTRSLANVLAIAACSLLNFVGSDRLVFAPPARRGTAPRADERRGRSRGALAIAVGHPTVPGVALIVRSLSMLALAGDGGPVHPATLAAWHAYERQVDARYTRDTAAAFFAADTLGGPAIVAARRAGRRDADVPGPRRAPPARPAPDVPDGRIHHWVGATFVPRPDGRRSVIDSLEAHAGQESAPYDDVIASRLLSRDGDRVQVFLKLRRTKIITATYNTEHRVEYRRIGATRGIEPQRRHADRRARRRRDGDASARRRPPRTAGICGG